VSFAIEQGEFFTMLGQNGAGKTTTISILTTTLAPTAGSVRVGGHDVTARPYRNVCRRTFSSTVRFKSRLGFWKMMPTSRGTWRGRKWDPSLRSG
jgi:ABC-type multidrug transport system ATPase subunit